MVTSSMPAEAVTACLQCASMMGSVVFGPWLTLGSGAAKDRSEHILTDAELCAKAREQRTAAARYRHAAQHFRPEHIVAS